MRIGALLATTVLAATAIAAAQDSPLPRQFPEFRGTWVLDEKATEGLHPLATRTGSVVLYDELGVRVARNLVIATTPTALTLTEDGGLPEVYQFDGSETQVRDPKTNAPLYPYYRFGLVAGMLALTARTPRTPGTPRMPGGAEIVTDALSMPAFDVLRVERQLSIVGPDGQLMTLSRTRNIPHVLIYRRQ